MTARRCPRWALAVAAALVAVGCRTAPGASTAASTAAAVAPLPSSGCRPGAGEALVGVRRQLVVDGATRNYLIDAPAGAADVARPLVLAFHGFGGSAAGLREGIGLPARAAAGAFVAIHPEGRDDVRLLGQVGRGWDLGPDDTRDLPFVTAVLDAVEQERCMDRRRVFATGFSNGGFFANLLGCRLADRLAAVAAVAGARALDPCTPAAPLPILFFHGTADPVVPVRMTAAARAWWRGANHCGDGDDVRGGCRAARGCAADVVVCEGPQGHSWPVDATSRIWEFFQAHPRS